VTSKLFAAVLILLAVVVPLVCEPAVIPELHAPLAVVQIAVGFTPAAASVAVITPASGRAPPSVC